MYLVDSHCHLDALDYENLHESVESVLAKAKVCNVGFVLAIATTLAGFCALYNQIGKRDNLAFSCGVHPLTLGDYDDERLQQLATLDAVVALGETGLDYYYQQENMVQQQSIFRQHIRLGNKLKKPIIIHTRAASQDTLTILREEQIMNCGGVLHCFTEDREIARQLLDLGLYISFSGIVTFRNATALRDVVRYVPIERMLLETDSPYLAPVPYRGKENQPAYLYDIAKYLSILKGVTLERLTQKTSDNFSQLFSIKLPH